MQTHSAVQSRLQHGLLKSQMDGVERRMAALTEQYGPKVTGQPSAAAQAATYHFAAGGRRLRARLAIHAALALGLDPADGVALATAAELLHNASLIHDDLQDRSSSRRGTDTVWAAFGDDVAICAGDLLLSAAYSALSQISDRSKLPALIARVHERTSTAIGGQCADLSAGARLHGDIAGFETIAVAKSGALPVGGNPFDTTSSYGLIHYLERAYGVHFAMSGTRAITRALGGLMQRQGIDIRLGETVSRISVTGGVATGVVLADGRMIAADVIVSNADAAHLYSAMVPKPAQARTTRLKLAAAHYSMGLFVLNFGTRATYPDVAHHTIWLGPRYRELLADIFDRKVLAEDFSLYLHRPTATDPSFAPPGCDSFYVLCPVPNLQAGIDWATEAPRLQARIIAALDATILPGLAATITAEFCMTPEDFRHDYLSEHGAGFSIAPLFRQSAWFRFYSCRRLQSSAVMLANGADFCSN